MSLYRLVASTLAICLLAALSLAAQALDRIDTKVALAQVITKFDPDVPAAAAAARVGGVVIADVTIGVNGRVSSVSILGGPALLHAAAQTALRQWTFKPFVRNGKPRAVITILEVNFPDPVREEQDRNREALRAAQYACDREIEKNRATAAPLCKVAYELGAAVPPGPVVANTYGMEEMAGRTYISSLAAANRIPEALEVAKELLLRRSPPKVDDRVAAEYQVTVAILQARTGAYDDTEASFAKAYDMYEGMAAQSPRARESVAATLKQALQTHASIRRARGDASGAAALEARAAAVTVPERAAAATPPRVTTTTRRVGDVTVRETSEWRITDDDVRQIQSVLAPKGVWWMIASQVSGPEPQPVPGARVCLEASVVTPTLRRGTCAILNKLTPGNGQKGGWQKFAEYDFVQLPDGDASTQEPIEYRVDGKAKAPSDATLLALFAFVRSKAVPTQTTLRRSDVQPWPFERVLVLDNDWRVTLKKSDDSARQDVTMRVRGSGWEIVEMR